jgi:hypothetical protein
MKTKLFFFLAAAVSLLLASASISAHHGSSVYDGTKVTTMKATVTDYLFMNPHTEIQFEVKGPDGKVEKWTAEASSLVTMARLGWTKSTMKPGDQITVYGNCAKNGSHTMRLSKVIFPDGKETIVVRGEDYADQ